MIQHEESHEAQMENRQLRETIDRLREELEKSRIGVEDLIQKALADAQNEIKQLESGQRVA